MKVSRLLAVSGLGLSLLLSGCSVGTPMPDKPESSTTVKFRNSPKSSTLDQEGTFTVENAELGTLALAGSSICPPVLTDAHYAEDTLTVTLDHEIYMNKPCTKDLMVKNFELYSDAPIFDKVAKIVVINDTFISELRVVRP